MTLVSVTVIECFPKVLKRGVGVTATLVENTEGEGKEGPPIAAVSIINALIGVAHEYHRHTDGFGIDDSNVSTKSRSS